MDVNSYHQTKEGRMNKGKVSRKLLPTLLITVYTVPGLVSAQTPAVTNTQPAPGAAPEKKDVSQAVKQEVAQFLRQGDTNRVTVNIAGQPGTYFRLLYSVTGKEGSYQTVPGSTGVIRDDGMASFSFEPGELGKDELFLRLVASDRADFSDPRITPKPIVLEVESIKVKERGWKEKFEGPPVTALAGVRG
jgi:hypothetical protein